MRGANTDIDASAGTSVHSTGVLIVSFFRCHGVTIELDCHSQANDDAQSDSLFRLTKLRSDALPRRVPIVQVRYVYQAPHRIRRFH